MGLSGWAAAQDTSHVLWIMPSDTALETLQAEASGRVSLTPARQQASRNWRLEKAPNGRFYLLCAAYGGRRGMELRQGKPHLAAGRGQAWQIKRQFSGEYQLQCPQGPLGDHDWVLWSRQRLDRQPDAGNYLRSDLGQFWRVLPRSLVGRARPGGPVVRSFPRGTVLRVDYGRGGSDSILWNQTDESGNTWFKVKDKKGKALDCYVRASSDYLRPFDLDTL